MQKDGTCSLSAVLSKLVIKNKEKSLSTWQFNFLKDYMFSYLTSVNN